MRKQKDISANRKFGILNLQNKKKRGRIVMANIQEKQSNETTVYKKDPQTIVFATHNKNKIEEIKKIVKDFPNLENINFISMAEADVTEDIVEDGKTYEENALLKAKYVCEKTGMIALADDSGVEIEALHGMPGIFSARFLGEQTSQEVKNA